MRTQRVSPFDYALVVTVCILIVPTLGNPRPNYFDRNENPELSQWAEQHQEQVHEMANRVRTEYNRAMTQHSGQRTSGGTTPCKTTCIPSTIWVSHTGKTQEEINQIAKEMTLKLVSDLNSGKVDYNQITQPNWFENYAAHELHLLQNQHYQNNFGAQIHIPQGGTYYQKTEKKVYEYKQEGGNIQPTFIYKPSVTTYEEKKHQSHEHSSSGYPTVYYGHGQTQAVEKIEKLQEEHKDVATIAHVPVYTDSYFHASDRRGHKQVNRRPNPTPAIHVSYNSMEETAFAENAHNVYPTSVPVTVTHKEQHTATVEKQTIPIIYKYGNNERRTEQTNHRNRTNTYRRPSTTSTNSNTTSRRNITTTHVEKHTRRPTKYSETKHSIYKHLKIDDGTVPNYKPRVVHKESKVRHDYEYGGGSISSETMESHQNHTISTNSGNVQINYRPAYVGHQSRYNRTHGYNYTNPRYVIPGGTSQTSHTSQNTQTSQHARPGYAVIGGGQNSQTSQSSHTSQETGRPGYIVTVPSGGSQHTGSIHSSQTEQHTRPGYVVVGGGGQQTSGISESSQSSHHATRPGYIVTSGGGGNKVIQTTYANHTTQELHPGYLVVPGAHSNQISQTNQNSEQIIRPGYIVTQGGGSQTSHTSQSSHTSQHGSRPGYVVLGGGGSQTVESSHTSQASQHGGRPGYVVVGGGGSQTVESSHTSQTSQHGGRPGFVIVGGGGSQTVGTSYTNQTSQQGSRPSYIITGGGGQTIQTIHSSQTAEQNGRPGYVMVTGGGSQTVQTSHTSETSVEVAAPEFVITGGGNSQIIKNTHSSEMLQQGERPEYLVVAGGGTSQTVESSHTSHTAQGTRPGYIIAGVGGQTINTSHFNQTSQQGVRPGHTVVVGGGSSQTIESSHKNQTSQHGYHPGFIITGGGGSQTVETSHASQTSQQGSKPGFIVVGGGGSQTLQTSYTNQTSQQGTRPGYLITGGGQQTIQTIHSNHSSEQSGRPGWVITGGGSQTFESSHTSETSHEVAAPEFIITGGGNSQIIETTHREILQQGERPEYLVVAGGGTSQTVETSHASQTSQHGGRPGLVVVGGGGSQTVESSQTSQTSQHGGRPGFVVVGGEGSQTVVSSNTSQTSHHGGRPGFVVVGGGGSQTVESSQTSQTSQHGGRPGFVVVGGGGSQSVESSNSSQTTHHGGRPGFVVVGGGGSQTVESSQTSQTSQHGGRPGFVVVGGGGSQTVETSYTNQTSQHGNRPGYIITGGGGHTVETSHINQTSENTGTGFIITGGGNTQTVQSTFSNETSQHTRPGFIINSGGSQSMEITHSNQSSEQTSNSGVIITGGGSSQTIESTQITQGGQQSRPGYVVVTGGGQSSQNSYINQTSEQTSRPGHIIVGGGSQTSETSETSHTSQGNHRPGYLVVTGGGGSQISQTSQSNETTMHGHPGFVVIDGGASQNYSQEFISQLNRTDGGVYIANGSYISGHGWTNWTSETNNNNKKPLVIISQDRGDQPPHQFEDYYDSEELLEKEPGIGFYPVGVKPEIGLLVTRRPPTANQHDNLNIHGSHTSHSQSSHHNHRNHQTHVYPGSSVATTHKHQTHTIGTLQGDSRPLLEHHHVDKQLVKEGSSYAIHHSQGDIRENELRESYGFNKSKHHHESGDHRHSGIRHGQHQHSHSRNHHHSGLQHHAHRQHHRDGQSGKTEYYIITSDGRRQNVSRHEHEKMLKSQVNHLLENFVRTVERDIQDIAPDEDKESMQMEIVFDNMEELLLNIKKLVGDDPDTKQMIEQIVEKDLEPFKKRYRVKRSFLNLPFGSKAPTTKPTESRNSQSTENIEEDLESELFKEFISGTVDKLPIRGLSRENKYNPNDVTYTHKIPDTQNSYDLTQHTQTEDLSLLLGYTNQLTKPLNPDTTQQLEDYLSGSGIGYGEHINHDTGRETPDTESSDELTQQTQTEDLSQFSLGYTNQPAKPLGSIYVHPDTAQKHLEEDYLSGSVMRPSMSSINYHQHINPDSGKHTPNTHSSDELTQQTQSEDLSQFSLRYTNRPVKPLVSILGNSDKIQKHLEQNYLSESDGLSWSSVGHGEHIRSDTGGQISDTQNSDELTQQTQTEDLSQFSLGYTNQLGSIIENQDTVQKHLQQGLSWSSGGYREHIRPDIGGQLSDTQSSDDLSQQTQTVDLSQFSVGYTNQPPTKPLESILENADTIQKHLEQNYLLGSGIGLPWSSDNYGMYVSSHNGKQIPNSLNSDELTQQTQFEDLSQFSLGYTNQQAKPLGSTLENQDAVQKHLEEDLSKSHLNIKPGSTNIHHNQQTTNNINQSTYESIYQPIGPTTITHPTLPLIQPDSTTPSGNNKLPGTCCWQPGGPNYQPIGSQTDNTNVMVGPISNKPSVNLINPIYQPIDKITDSSGKNESQYEATNISSAQQNKTTHTDKPIDKSSSIIMMPTKPIENEKSDEKLATLQEIQQPKRCCWLPASPKYLEIGTTTDTTNDEAIVGPIDNTPPQPCQSTSVSPINPVYIPIDVLPHLPHPRKPIESANFQNSITLDNSDFNPSTNHSTGDETMQIYDSHAVPIESIDQAELSYPENQQQSQSNFLTTVTEYQEGQTYDGQYISNQLITRPAGQPQVIPPKPNNTITDEQYKVDKLVVGSIYPTDTDEQYTYDYQQASYPIYSESTIYAPVNTPKQPTTGSMGQHQVDTSKPGDNSTVRQSQFNITEHSGPGYVRGPVYVSHYTPNQPIGRHEVISSETDEQYTDDSQQASYPIYSESAVYAAVDTPKQPTTGLVGQHQVDTSKPGDNSTVGQSQSNITEHSELGYARGSVYVSHYTPNQPIGRHEVISSDKDEQYTDDYQQASYPIYSESAVSAPVDTPKKITTGSMGQHEVNTSKPGDTSTVGESQFNIIEHSGPGYARGPVYVSHYTPNQPIGRHEVISPKPILAPPYQPMALHQPVHSERQFHVNNLQSTGSDYHNKIQDEQYTVGYLQNHYRLSQAPDGVISPVATPIYPHDTTQPAHSDGKHIVEHQPSHYTPKLQTIGSSDHLVTDQVTSPKNIVDPKYTPSAIQPIDPDEQYTIGLSSESNYELGYKPKLQTAELAGQQQLIYSNPVQLQINVPKQSDQIHQVEPVYDSQFKPKQSTTPREVLYIFNTTSENQIIVDPIPTELSSNTDNHKTETFAHNRNHNQYDEVNRRPGFIQIQNSQSSGDQSTVQQNSHHNIQSVPAVKVQESSQQENVLVKQDITHQLRPHHSIENQEAKTTNNTHEIIPQNSKPMESQNSDNRRGDQTSFDDVDYGDDIYEPNVITNPDSNEKIAQNILTQSHDDYFQYPDPDVESQQLTQKITKEDFTSFVKSPQRIKRQIDPITVLDYISKKSSNSKHFLVSAENDDAVNQQPDEAVIGYLNQPKNLNRI